MRQIQVRNPVAHASTPQQKPITDPILIAPQLNATAPRTQEIPLALQPPPATTWPVRETRRRLWLWLLPIAWATLIFIASSDSDSSARSSRLIGPLIRWLVPGISPGALDCVVFVVPKGAHVAEYAVLAILLGLALRHSRSRTEPWKLAWMLAVAYAITDEVHQALVPDRTGAVGDVALDAIGAAVGVLLIRWWLNRRSELCQAHRTDTLRSF